MTTEHKKPEVIDWSAWSKSDEGKKAADFSTLTNGDYLDNRLWVAFRAGAAYQRQLLESVLKKAGLL